MTWKIYLSLTVWEWSGPFRPCSTLAAADRKWYCRAVSGEASVLSRRISIAEACLVNSNHFPPWRRQTGSSFPRRYLVLQTFFSMDCDMSEGRLVGFGRWIHGRPVRKATFGLLPPHWKRFGSTSHTSNSRNSQKNHVTHTPVTYRKRRFRLRVPLVPNTWFTE